MIENLGANHKKLKGKKRKTVIGMTDLFRNVARVMLT